MMAHNILENIRLLANVVRAFQDKCVSGIVPIVPGARNWSSIAWHGHEPGSDHRDMIARLKLQRKCKDRKNRP